MITEIMCTKQHKDCPMKRHEKEVMSEKTIRARIYLYNISLPKDYPKPPSPLMQYARKAGQESKTIKL